jgi:hypothetical protein
VGKVAKKIAGLGGFGAVLAGPWGLAFDIGLGLIFSKIAEKKAKSAPSANFGTELNLSGDPVDVRKICYGRAWTSGTLRFRDSVGVERRELHLVVVLAGHACEDLEEIRADGELVTVDGSGNVTSPSRWVGLMNIREHLGSDSQTVDTTLDTAFTDWTSNHRLRGLTYVAITLTFNDDHMRSVPNFRFLVKGRKVYDPRLDTTAGGSGAHRVNDETTWAWSENAVLCANDFHRGVMINGTRIAGPGISSGRFLWSNVMAEANVCDENVVLAAALGNENRYTANGFIDPRQTHEEISQQFEQAFAGDFLFSDGKWRYFAGAYRAPTLALTGEHFVGPLRMVVHKSEADRRDTAVGRYAALSQDGTMADYAPFSLSTAVVGSERFQTIDFPLVNDSTDTGATYDGGARAQRIAKLLLERDAAGKLITCTTNLYGWRAVPGESISVTHAAFGLSAQTMRVMDVQLRPFQDDGKTGLVVDLTLAAGPSSLYTWSAEETALDDPPDLPQDPTVWPINHNWTPVLVNVTRDGATFTKTGGAAATWDSSVYSVEGFRACSVIFNFQQTNGSVMVGLNTDPTTDNDYASIDYAIYGRGDGVLLLYESGAAVVTFGAASYATTDQFRLEYDGLRVSYYQNNTLIRSSPLIGARLYLDSSFNTSAAAVNIHAFGIIGSTPASGVGWVGDSLGKPAGVRHIYSSDSTPDRAAFSIVGNALQIAALTTTGNAAGLAAIPIDDTKRYQVTVRYSATVAATSCFTLAMYELAGALPSGKTHIGPPGQSAGTREASVEEGDTTVTLINTGTVGTDAVEETYLYAPTSGTDYATLSLLNNTPSSSNSLIVDWVALSYVGSNADLLPGVRPPGDTYDIVPGAATTLYTTYDASQVDDAVDDFFNGLRLFVEQNSSRTYGNLYPPPSTFAGTDNLSFPMTEVFSLVSGYGITAGVRVDRNTTDTDLITLSSIPVPPDGEHHAVVTVTMNAFWELWSPGGASVGYRLTATEINLQVILVKR